jgi:hypothetical protein
MAGKDDEPLIVHVKWNAYTELWDVQWDNLEGRFPRFFGAYQELSASGLEYLNAKGADVVRTIPGEMVAQPDEVDDEDGYEDEDEDEWDEGDEDGLNKVVTERSARRSPPSFTYASDVECVDLGLAANPAAGIRLAFSTWPHVLGDMEAARHAAPAISVAVELSALEGRDLADYLEHLAENGAHLGAGHAAALACADASKPFMINLGVTHYCFAVELELGVGALDTRWPHRIARPLCRQIANDLRSLADIVEATVSDPGA